MCAFGFAVLPSVDPQAPATNILVCSKVVRLRRTTCPMRGGHQLDQPRRINRGSNPIGVKNRRTPTFRKPSFVMLRIITFTSVLWGLSIGISLPRRREMPAYHRKNKIVGGCAKLRCVRGRKSAIPGVRFTTTPFGGRSQTRIRSRVQSADGRILLRRADDNGAAFGRRPRS